MTIASSDIDSDIQAQSEVLTAVRTEPEKLTTQKGQPKQCKYWVTGNCVQGDKCKDLHSWFSGSGFTLLRKLEGHTKAITGISFPSGSEKLYSCSKDKSIRAWDSHTGQCAGSVITDGEAGCLISEGPWLFVGLQSALKGWKLQTQADFSFSLLPGLVCSMVLDDDKLFAGMEGFTALCGIHDAEAKPILLCACNDNTVRLYDLPSFTERGRIFSKREVEVIEIGSNGLFFTGDASGEIAVWKLLGDPCEEIAL
ncbi:UNVERIFIED_CONTAM: Zinc finger CCCH domain-containing protein 48 [Sesamum calycinum]|uniref:Zinc finger CCCH domain-containing protein 48 n=1 Tax=Sesamum calycinum TaxID=2727403 RepID=A0AAW2T105_9LAMI